MAHGPKNYFHCSKGKKIDEKPFQNRKKVDSVRCRLIVWGYPAFHDVTIHVRQKRSNPGKIICLDCFAPCNDAYASKNAILITWLPSCKYPVR